MRANTLLQQERVFPSLTVATDQSAFDHILEAQKLIDLGEYDKSITYLNIISQRYTGNNKEVRARLLGALARNYLKLGLNRKAIQFWEDAIEIIENSSDDAFLKAVFRNNMSLAYINLGETERAKQNLLRSVEEYPLTQTYQKLSDLVLDESRDFELSNFYLTSGLKLINNPRSTRKYVDENYTKKLNLAYITEGYAYHYYVKNDLNTSLQKYLEVLSIAEELKRVNLRLEILKKLGFLYQEMGNSEQSTHYFAEHIRVNDSLRIIMNNSLSIPVQDINGNEDKSRNKDNNTFLYYALGIALAIAMLVVIFYYRKRTKTAGENEIPHPGKNNNLVPSQEAEEEILQKLAQFEASEAFLDKDISLSLLIGKLNSNSKYFRQILKKHKNQDYTSYINELRINYIVNKLETEPEYLNYKISYLAEESGFSSHSKFSATFKRVVKCSPSEFIENLQIKNSAS